MARKSSPFLVGLVGYDGVGKTAMARRMTKELGFYRLPFGAAMREELDAIDPVVTYGGTTMNLRAARSRAAAATADTDAAEALMKERCAGYRGLLRTAGMVGRRVDPDYWVKKWWQRRDLAPASRFRMVVADDVRFLNEAESLVRAGGVLVNVQRPGFPMASGPSEEQEAILKKLPHHTLVNDGTADEAFERLMRVLGPPEYAGYAGSTWMPPVTGRTAAPMTLIGTIATPSAKNHQHRVGYWRCLRCTRKTFGADQALWPEEWELQRVRVPWPEREPLGRKCVTCGLELRPDGL